MTLSSKFGKYVVLPLVIAVVISVAVIAVCVLAVDVMPDGIVPDNGSDLTVCDELAQPYFDEAHEGVREVVAEETTLWSRIKMAGRITGDKLFGTTHAPEYVQNVLEDTVIAPCREGAKIYGCDIAGETVADAVLNMQSAQMSSDIRTAATTAMDGVFTTAAIQSVHQAGTKAVLSTVTGAAVAASDGPLPVADVAGAAICGAGLLAGGKDFIDSYNSLPDTLTSALDNAIDGCREACRKEFSK